MSSKEQCFKDALAKYKESSGKDVNVDFEKQWVKDGVTGKWAPRADEGPIQKLFNSIKKTLRIRNGDEDPRPPGSANPVQLRRPDMTVTTKDGRQIVIDNKFTGKDGKPDGWRPGGQSGSDQRGDYNEINKQNGGKGQDLNLNKDVCKCNGEPQPVEVWKPVPGLSTNPNLVPFVPLPAPGGLPALPPMPALPPIAPPVPVPVW
ncbi:hypothetical protein BE11_29810 [Sorangium cellulosum]|nr:hypothetical protein BE11_29810 [Sorangium cellulosum]